MLIHVKIAFTLLFCYFDTVVNWLVDSKYSFVSLHVLTVTITDKVCHQTETALLWHVGVETSLTSLFLFFESET